MAFEKIIKNAFEESRNNTRLGDTLEEINEIQNYIKNAKKIYVPNKNGIKVEVLNRVLKEYNLPPAEILQVNTNTADTSRIPALAKAYIALDQSDAELIIARGRLGIPGSGSLLIFIDNKGRILTAGTSPSHVIHQKSLEDAVYEEACEALEKIGFKKEGWNMDIDTGITSEVLTIKSETKLIDIFNKIISKKSTAIFDYIEGLKVDTDSKIIVIGTYFTGIGIVKKLSEKYTNILLIDIYPHLKELFQTKIGGELKNNVNFSSDLDLIYEGDIVIDTTGFGGINVDESSKINTKTFIIEDPVAEDNDELLKDKNNINQRLNAVNCQNKAILKTKGLNTKTSGTMTLTIGILTNVLNNCLKEEGVLYSACEMGFFEEIIFKEKNIEKFVELTDKKAFKVSTIKPFSCDELINNEIKKIESKMI